MTKTQLQKLLDSMAELDSAASKAGGYVDPSFSQDQELHRITAEHIKRVKSRP